MVTDAIPPITFSAVTALPPAEPEMLLMRQGKVDIVDYNHRTHYRIKYTDSFSGVYKWFVRKLGKIPFLEEVRNVNVYAPLEELYQKEVVKQKEDYPYKKYTPEETEQSLKEAFVKAQQTEKWKEIQKKIDTPEEIWMDEPVEGLVKELEKNPPEGLKFEMGKTLEELIERWWCDVFTSKKYYWDMETTIQDLCDRVFLWLPKEQFANSQNLYVELTVEGFNDAIKKIKSKIHNKKV